MSIDLVTQQTLQDKTSPQNIHLAQQAFLNYNIERIRDFVIGNFGVNHFLVYDPTSTSTADQLIGPVCLNSEDPVSAVSRMNKFGDTRIQALNNLSNLELATLQPKVELRKVIYETQVQGGGTTTPTVVLDRPIFEGLIKTRSNSFRQIPLLDGDVDDIQIQNVNFSFKNQNPLGADRLVGVTLDLVMLKADSLTKKRTLSGGVDLANNTIPQSDKETFRFTDLFMRPLPVSASEYDKRSYQIRLTLGWELGDHPRFRDSLDGYDLTVSALKSQEITLNLQLVNYDLSFRQDGKIVLSLDYMSIIDDAYEDETTDLFRGGFGIAQELNEGAESVRIAGELEKLSSQLDQTRLQSQNVQFTLAAKPATVTGLPPEAPAIADPAGAIAKLRAKETDLETRIEALKNELDSIRSGRAAGLQSISTNIKTYSRILADLYQRKEVYSFQVEMANLIQYSPQFQKNLLATHPELYFENLDNMKDTSDNTFNLASSRFTRAAGGATPQFSQILEQEVLNLGEVTQNSDATARIKAAANIGGAGLASAFLKSEFFSGTPTIRFQNPSGDVRPRSVAAAAEPTNVFYFILYGDLVAAAMRINQANVGKNMKAENIGIILNSILYTRDYPIPPVVTQFASGAVTVPPKDININLAYVPITLQNYANFMKTEVIDKKRTKYPIGEFIRDTLTKLVAPAINLTYFGQKPKEKLLLRANTVDITKANVTQSPSGSSSYPLDLPFDPLLGVINVDAASGVEFTNIANLEDPKIEDHFLASKITAGTRSVYKNFTYLNCYGYSKGVTGSPSIRSNYEGNATEDQKNGVYHFTPALSRGLLKDVKFSKRATKYLAEASVFDALQGRDDQFTRLWNVFDAELVMVGNNLFAPGSLIFIDTTSTGLGNPTNANSVSRFMGLGGYYLVVSVEHSIVGSGAGKWETRVKAIWQTSGARPA